MLKQIINSTYKPIIIAESRIIAVITLYRYIFDFLEFQKVEKAHIVQYVPSFNL